MMEKYNHYSAEDFLDDDDFIRHVKYQRPEDVGQWNDWLSSSPPNEEAYKEAFVCLSAMLSVVRIEPEPQAGRQSWLILERQIGTLERQRRGRRLVRMFAAAAVACIGLVLASYWYYQAQVSVVTGYGEQRQVVLPDHSTVTLNANSSLTWYRAWNWRHGREVWLTGEALFKVEPGARAGAAGGSGNPAERFTAYAGDLSVAVLGTTFNIRQRRGRIMVSLLSGKISITNRSRPGPSLILQPGDAANSDGTAVQVSRIVRLTSQPQAWVDHKIMASGMTVQDIIDNYEDIYGYHIVLGNPAQAAKKIDGTLSLETEDGVVNMLANILNAYIHREGKTIYLRPK